MKIKNTYLVQYRKPFARKGRIVKLHECGKGVRARWFIDDGETMEETNRDFAQTLKNTPI